MGLDGPIYEAKSRQVGSNGYFIASHDDLSIFELEKSVPQFEGAIVVTNDNYKDINDRAKKDNDLRTQNVIEYRLLQFNFFYQNFVPPKDPLGRMYVYDEGEASRSAVRSNPRKIMRISQRATAVNMGVNYISWEDFLKF